LTQLYTETCTVDRTETRCAASRGSISTPWPTKDHNSCNTNLLLSWLSIE